MEFTPYDSRRAILQELLSVLFGLMPLHLCMCIGRLSHRHGSAVESRVVEDYRVAMVDDVLSVFSDCTMITPYHHCKQRIVALGIDLAQRSSALMALTTLSSWMKRLLRHYEELTSFYGMNMDMFFLPRDYHEWKRSRTECIWINPRVVYGEADHDGNRRAFIDERFCDNDGFGGPSSIRASPSGSNSATT